MEKADFECKIVVGGIAYPLADRPILFHTSRAFGRLAVASSSHHAGNHDISLDRNLSETQPSHSSQPPQDPKATISLLTSSKTITYLTHISRTIRLNSPQGPQTTFTIFGSPSSPINPAHSPDFTAFQYPVPPQTPNPPRLWDDVAPGTDIIVTHTPPHTHLDERKPGLHTGCPSLLNALQRIRPRLAVCGHVHEGRGAEHITWGPGGADAVEPWVDPAPEGRKMCLVDLRRRVAGVETCVVNCAVMARSYPQGGHARLNKPIVVDVELPVWE